MLTSLLNTKRRRDYPLLFLLSGLLVLALNVLLHRGWLGGLTGMMMWGDFIANFAGGIQYRADVSQLYDPYLQEQSQATLIAPTISTHFAPFISMPHVAWAYSLISPLPLAWAIGLELVLSLGCLAAAVILMQRFLVPGWLRTQGLTATQLGIILGSSLAFIIGLQAGQTHTLTLLLVTGIIVACRGKKWALAGILAGLLIYKPQFALGFLLVWLAWRRWDALLSFGLTAGLWVGVPLVQHGLGPFQAYLEFSEMLLMLPYARDNFPVAILSTPYALLASIVPLQAASVLRVLLATGVVVASAGLAWFAHRQRNAPAAGRDAALVLAVFFPLLVLPHALIYDLLILAPAILLLAENHPKPGSLLKPTIAIYLGTFLLPLAGYALHMALTALIPAGFFASQFRFFRQALASMPHR